MGEISIEQTENEKQWNKVGKGYIWVSVGKEGHVVAVHKDGGVFYRDGVTKTNPVGTGWTDLTFEGH
jgi:hypothetical protein